MKANEKSLGHKPWPDVVLVKQMAGTDQCPNILSQSVLLLNCLSDFLGKREHDSLSGAMTHYLKRPV